VPVPQKTGWAENPLDAFIASRHEELGLTPSGEASKRVLIRRLSLDLLGLLPEPEEVEAFARDPAPDSYQRLVDRYLSSPLYGERWARHWLDVARWAESEGYAENNARPTSWRYRDYVLQSFNGDRPYDRFLREQVAGDEVEPATDESLIATGFLAAARISADEGDRWRQRNDLLVDVVNATANAFLGLTLQCAQCHDHKFDPLTQRDYYRFQGFFVKGLPGNLVLADPALWAEHRSRRPPEYESVMAEYDAILRRARARALTLGLEEIPEAMREALRTPPEARSPAEERTARAAESRLNFRIAMNALEPKMTEEDRKRFGELKKLVADLEGKVPPPPSAWGFYSPVTASRKVPTLLMRGNFPLLHDDEELRSARPYLLGRGDVFQPAARLEPGWPAVFGNPPERRPQELIPVKPRLALAEWLASPSHPLTARVWVNRLWHYHFGRGLVETPGDFGVRGAPPSNQSLLDWLASELVEGGFSTKRIQRLIVSSRAYRQGSDRSAENERRDPGNLNLWRWAPRRLEAEALRDCMLLASGEIDRRLGGPSEPPERSGGSLRRSLYLFQRRDHPPAMQSLFDGPAGMEASCPRRHLSTSPLQPLFLLNSDFAIARGRAMAKRVAAAAGDDPAARIDLAVRLALGRPPDAAEAGWAREFFAGFEGLTGASPESPDRPAVIGVAIPRASQIAPALPLADGVWESPGDSLSFDDERGAGAVVRPAGTNVYLLHNSSPGPTAYAGHAPDPQRARVTYTFDRPVAVAEVELIVHRNGITRLEGFAGDDPGSLVSLGEATTPGAARGKPYEAEKSSHVFRFDPARLRPGRCFRFIVRETALADGYANYQAFPRLADATRVVAKRIPEAWTHFCQALLNLNEFVYLE
jgi:hypothetical protein